MNTLFNTSFDDDPRPHDLPGVRIRANSYELAESNVRLKLTLVDTVGFGDQINKDQSYKVCIFISTHSIGSKLFQFVARNQSFEMSKFKIDFKDNLFS